MSLLYFSQIMIYLFTRYIFLVLDEGLISHVRKPISVFKSHADSLIYDAPKLGLKKNNSISIPLRIASSNNFAFTQGSQGKLLFYSQTSKVEYEIKKRISVIYIYIYINVYIYIYIYTFIYIGSNVYLTLQPY